MICIGLYHPKYHLNVGAVIRAMDAFGGGILAIHGRKYKHAPTDSEHADRRIPIFDRVDLYSFNPVGYVPIAVEVPTINDISEFENIVGFKHPHKAMYIFGPENGRLPNDLISRCAQKIYIPSGCLNLAMATNIVLYDRMTKECPF